MVLIIGDPHWKNFKGMVEMQIELCFDYPAATSHRGWYPKISLFDHLYWLRRLLIQRCGGGRIFPNLDISHPKMNFEFEDEEWNNIFPLASIPHLKKIQESIHERKLNHLRPTRIFQ